MGDLKTEPGWKPPRKGPSDRLLIAALSAAVALLEAWHTIRPAQAAESGLSERVARVEADVAQVRETVGEIKGRLGRK